MKKLHISDQFVNMLVHLHRGATFGYYHTLPSRESSWWPAGNPTNLFVGKDDHVYYGVHGTTKIPSENAKGVPSDPRYVRAQRKYIASINCLIGEIDMKSFGNSIANVMNHISGLAFKPSVQIFSGGGVHLYWMLRDPFIISNAAQRKHISHIHREWSILVKGDASKDITRVLRVPGTFNPKYTPHQLVMFIDYSMDRLYDLDDLAGLLPPPLDPPSSHSLANDVLGWKSTQQNPIDDFNRQVRVSELLEQHGYQWHGNGKMLSPYSTTRSPGVTVDEQTNRVFVHHTSDPLSTGYWARAFDILKILEFGGNWKLAKEAIQGSI